MTPKEKAIELVEKFKNRSIELGETHSQLMAEANALIAVDEILHDCIINRIWYWETVKLEIKSL